MKKNFFIQSLISYLLTILAPVLALGILSSSLTYRVSLREYMGNADISVMEIKDTLENNLSNLYSLSASFDTNLSIIRDARDIFRKTEPLSWEDYKLLNIIKSFINVPAYTQTHIHSIYYYINNKNGMFLSSVNGISQMDDYYDTVWYDSYVAHQSSTEDIWMELRGVKPYAFLEPEPVLSLYKKMYSTNVIDNPDGLIVLNLKGSYFEKYLQGKLAVEGQSLYLIDRDGQLLFSAGPGQLLQEDVLAFALSGQRDGQLKADGKVYLLSSIYSPQYGLHILSSAPRSQVLMLSNTLTSVTIVLIGLSFLVGVYLSVRNTRNSYRRLEGILSLIEAAEQGRELPEAESHRSDIYGHIIRNIVRQFVTHSFLKLRYSERKYHLRTMELLALQSQINPHFLYNALDIIYWKSIKLEGSESELAQMAQNLSRILRYSLSDPGSLVDIREEIEVTQSYTYIQETRHKGDIRFLWDYDPFLLEDTKIMKLTLQPLIENSITHGLRKRGNMAGAVKVRINSRNNRLYICVIDNGAGISKEDLQSVKEKLAIEHAAEEKHIGIYNIYRRLILLYGETAVRFDIRSKQNFGTSISICIPKEAQEQAFYPEEETPKAIQGQDKPEDA